MYTPTVEFPELHERKIDLAFARLANDPVQGRLTEELDAEVLFNDGYSVVVGEKSKWARRKVGLADLVDEPWIMTPLDALGDSFVGGAFRRRGLKLPRMIITTFSIHLRNNLVGSGEIHHRSAPFGASNLPETSCSQRATNRLVCSATTSHCNAEKSDSYSGGAVIHPMCPRRCAILRSRGIAQACF